MGKFICLLFGHAFITSNVRDESDIVFCPRCKEGMTVENYDLQRYGETDE